jgi:hypothetical protein
MPSPPGPAQRPATFWSAVTSWTARVAKRLKSGGRAGPVAHQVPHVLACTLQCCSAICSGTCCMGAGASGYAVSRWQNAHLRLCRFLDATVHEVPAALSCLLPAQQADVAGAAPPPPAVQPDADTAATALSARSSEEWQIAALPQNQRAPFLHAQVLQQAACFDAQSVIGLSDASLTTGCSKGGGKPCSGCRTPVCMLHSATCKPPCDPMQRGGSARAYVDHCAR